jgi:hypothetical protein
MSGGFCADIGDARKNKIAPLAIALNPDITAAPSVKNCCIYLYPEISESPAWEITAFML